MICLVSLVTFGVMGIFSAKYRGYGREAFRCVFRRVTLRKCDTAFDKKMKAKITGKIFKRSPKAAGFVYKNFEAISWVFTGILIFSMAYSAFGLYNLATYGSCDPHSTDCIFAPGSVACGSEQCQEDGCECEVDETACMPPDYIACEGDCDCINDICG